MCVTCFLGILEHKLNYPIKYEIIELMNQNINFPLDEGSVAFTITNDVSSTIHDSSYTNYKNVVQLTILP